MSEFSTLEILITNILIFFLLIFPPQATPNYLNSFIKTSSTLLNLTLSQHHTISNILKNSLGWMNNTKSSQNNSSQSELEFPQIIFALTRKDYTVAELPTTSSADFLDLIYQHNVIPPESPFAAIRDSIPTLNLLIIVVPSFTQYKIYYCDNCPTLGQRFTLCQLCQLCPTL